MKPKDLSTSIQAPSQPHRRLLSIEEQRFLASLLSNAFQVEISEKSVGKIMNYVSLAEKRMVGRMASHVEDLIIHYVMRLVASQGNDLGDAAHMEIGTLFGGTVLLAHHASRLAECGSTLHVIDPFEGYYGRGHDIITGEEINRTNFLENLARLNIPQEDVVIHQGYSTDSAIIAECQSLKIRSLLIDGDHSYAGIKSDWENFSPLVIPGGYVLIDNYNDQFWPDVMRYVNNEVLPHLYGEWEVVLVYATSLLLRRTDVPRHTTNTDPERLPVELRAAQAVQRQLESALRQVEADKNAAEEESARLREQLVTSQAEATAVARKNQELLEGLKGEVEQLSAEKRQGEEESARLRELLAASEAEGAERRQELAKVTGDLKELHELYVAALIEADKANDQQQVVTEETAAMRANYEAELSTLRELLAAREARLAELTAELKELHALYLVALTEADQAQEQQHPLALRIEALQAELQRRDQAITELHNSLSWKVTAPLRAMAKPLMERGR